MLAEMYCRINGCAGSRGGSMHLIDKSVGMAGTSAECGYERIPDGAGQAFERGATAIDYARRELIARLHGVSANEESIEEAA